jgi:RNA polymerase sigma-70 factor (ECF subfamily)
VDEATKAETGGLSTPHDATIVPPSDEELARRAQRGCSASFEELVRRFQVPLLQFLRRWAAHEDAEDLVQDTLVRAYQNLHRYRPSWRFATWLFTIARRLSINQQRRKRLKAAYGVLETIEDHGPRPGQLVAEEESRRQLWNLAAEVLTEPQMAATWLYYVEEMSLKQIARVLGRSQVSAKAALFRARKRLSVILREPQPDNPVKNSDTPMKTRSCRTALESSDG